MSWQLFHGDALEVLKRFPDASFDAMVTDCPAGVAFMGREWDTFGKGGRGNHCRKTGAGKPCSSPGFAGDVHWDKSRRARDEFIKFLSGILQECFRVLKPGAHILVWALPRTSHWTGMAIEEAGFEVRDNIVHYFGAGFPKSLNVGKAIDQKLGVQPEVAGEFHTTYGLNKSRVEQGYRPNEVQPGHLTRPTSPEAQQWEGWGTAMKPSHENWILARKPLEGTIAENVLKYNCGVLNIDGARSAANGRWPSNAVFSHHPSCKKVGTKSVASSNPGNKIPGDATLNCFGKFAERSLKGHAVDGREEVEAWNCHPDCPIRILDLQGGRSVSRKAPRGGTSPNPMSWGEKRADGEKLAGYNDVGGVSRFFPTFPSV